MGVTTAVVHGVRQHKRKSQIEISKGIFTTSLSKTIHTVVTGRLKDDRAVFGKANTHQAGIKKEMIASSVWLEP